MHFDIFLSYRTREANYVRPLVSALEERGLSVWRDETEIRGGESITTALKAALASARLVVVYCTNDYFDSRICQWELTTAWLSGLAEGSPSSRIVIWMAATDIERVRAALGLAADAKWLGPCNPDSTEWKSAIMTIVNRVKQLNQTIGNGAARKSVLWFPHPLGGSNRFEGRLELIWRMAAQLHRRDQVGTTGAHRPDVVQLTGYAGIGKTLLALEYAQRFESGYPGGVFWFGTHHLAADDQLRSIAHWLGLRSSAAESADLVQLVKEELISRGPYLWILDDLPHGLALREVEARLAPTSNGHTLITTRSLSWETLGVSLGVAELNPREALALLTCARPVEAQGPDAARLCEALGYHPLALDLAAALVRRNTTVTPYSAVLQRVLRQDRDALDLAEHLQFELPTPIAKSVSKVMRDSFQALAQRSRRVLALAASGADAPLPIIACRSALAAATDASDYDEEDTLMFDELRVLSLIAIESETVTVHAVILRAVRFVFPKELLEEMEAKFVDACIQVLASATPQDRPPLALEAHAQKLIGPLVNPRRLLLARTLIDWRVRVSNPFLEWIGEITQWLPEILPPLGSLDRPWRMAEFLHQHRASWSASVLKHIEPLARKIANLPKEKLDDESAQWAFEMASFFFDCHQFDMALPLSYLAAAYYTPQQQGSDNPRFLEAQVLNSRCCYRCGDLSTLHALPLLTSVALKFWDPADPRISGLQEDVAGALYLSGHSNEALSYALPALGWKVTFLGAENPDSLSLGYSLALILRQQRRFEVASELLERQLETWLRIGGSLSHGTILTLRCLASTARSGGNHRRADEVEDRLFAALAQLGPLGVPLCIRSLEAWAAHHETEERLDRARTVYEQLKAWEEHVALPDSGLIAMLGLRAIARASGDLATETRWTAEIKEMIDALLHGDSPLGRTLLANRLAIRLLSDLGHGRLVDFLVEHLEWTEAVDLLESGASDSFNSADDSKRAALAKRASTRLRAALSLRERNSTLRDSAACRTELTLAVALAQFDPTAALQKLETLGWIESDQTLPADDRHTFLRVIKQLRTDLRQPESPSSGQQ